jgi:hypothetical protein
MLITAWHTIKVLYDHTHIASYWHCGARSVGRGVRLLALDNRNTELAGGLSSNSILLGSAPTVETEVYSVGLTQWQPEHWWWWQQGLFTARDIGGGGSKGCLT